VRFRTYSPTLGRWLERDPAGYVDGMDLYEYVRGGPIDAVDPSGRWTVPTSALTQVISAVMQYLDCGIRVASQNRGKRAGVYYYGHVWLEWKAPRSSPKGGTARYLEAIGYWPLQYFRRGYPDSSGNWLYDDFFSKRIACSTPLPAGARFQDSTLFGPPLDHDPLRPMGPKPGFNPESCGMNDPLAGSGDNEWKAIRRLRPTSYCGIYIGPDGKWHESTPQWLQAGGSRGTSCAAATCGQIIDCLRHVWPRREWGIGYKGIDRALGGGYACDDFVGDALDQCCLTRGCKSR